MPTVPVSLSPVPYLALRLLLSRAWRSLRGFRLGFEMAKVAFPTRFSFQPFVTTALTTGVGSGTVISASISSFPSAVESRKSKNVKLVLFLL